MKIIKNSLTISMALVTMGAFSTLSAGNTKAETVNSKPIKEWYVSNKVSVYDQANDKTYEGTNPAVFGRVGTSVDGHDQNDIPTFGSVMTRKAAVVFVQAEWEERSGEYHSDYHDTKGGEKDSWKMTVFSSVPNAKVTLKWDGLYAMTPKEGGYDNEKILTSSILEDLYLIDTETNEETSAVYDGKLNSYTFTMGAEGSRVFIWQQGTKKTVSNTALISTAKYIKVKKKEKKVKDKKAAKLRKEFIKKNKHEKFGLPPM